MHEKIDIYIDSELERPTKEYPVTQTLGSMLTYLLRNDLLVPYYGQALFANSLAKDLTIENMFGHLAQLATSEGKWVGYDYFGLTPERARFFDENFNKRFIDAGITGDLLGSEDFIHIKGGDSKNWESSQWYGNGGYHLKYWKTLRKGEVCEEQGEYAYLGVCLGGGAVYQPVSSLSEFSGKPSLEGYYSATTHSALQERHKEEFRIANDEYQRLLTIIIKNLAKRGKL